MPLIDGKYELLGEHAGAPGQTVMSAAAPDGSAVNLVWFDLEPHEETLFEQYRRALRRIKREGRAALYDVVSRPGAHYVVWQVDAEARPARPDRELEELLEQFGYEPEHADVRKLDGLPVLFGLAFDGTAIEPILPVQPESTTRESDLRTWLARQPEWLLRTGLTVLLLAGAALFLAAGFALRSNSRVVTIPQVLGANVNEAAATLHGLGLAVQPLPVASAEEIGTVIQASPGAGEQLRPGRTVTLSYALPPGSVTPTEVPRLITERHPDRAEELLAGQDLDLGSVSWIAAEQPAGTVIDQRPGPGGSVGAGSQVDVLVSSGPARELTFLPDLAGMSISDGQYFARLAGFSPDRVIIDEAAVPGRPGEIVAQSLPPFQLVDRDEAVLRLIVAQGTTPAAQEPAALPSFVGLSEEEALELAQRLLGDDATVELIPVADRRLPEGVVDQSPPAGAEPGDSLGLYVNLYPVVVPRPDASAGIREPEPREVPYRWFIEPGISQQTARVYATNLAGDRVLVDTVRVQGGEMLEGAFTTTEPGPIRFSLTLNGEPYGGTQLVR